MLGRQTGRTDLQQTDRSIVQCNTLECPVFGDAKLHPLNIGQPSENQLAYRFQMDQWL